MFFRGKWVIKEMGKGIREMKKRGTTTLILLPLLLAAGLVLGCQKKPYVVKWEKGWLDGPLSFPPRPSLQAASPVLGTVGDRSYCGQSMVLLLAAGIVGGGASLPLWGRDTE